MHSLSRPLWSRRPSYAQDSADAYAAKKEAENIYFEALDEYDEKYPDNANHQSTNAKAASALVKAKHKIYIDFKKKEEEAAEKADKYFKNCKRLSKSPQRKRPKVFTYASRATN